MSSDLTDLRLPQQAVVKFRGGMTALVNRNSFSLTRLGFVHVWWVKSKVQSGREFRVGSSARLGIFSSYTNI